MSPDPRIGTTLAGYRIESVIGRGGMGVVYLAEHLRLERKVALKVLAPELAEDERFRDRLIHESKLAASLDHPNIVDIYDAGEADGLLYLSMRYVGGKDLKTLIARDGALAPERAVALLTQVASALDVAHERGLVHRDVKSANVLVEPAAGSLGEHAYLTDFGLTKRPDSMTGLTKTGQFLGSVEYAAPEQFEGKPIDARTDIYSLGCVAFECLTGRVPFQRDTEASVMYAHLREEPPRISGTGSDLPSELDPVLSRGMAKDPKDRYKSAGAFAEAIRKPPSAGVTGLPRVRRRRAILAVVAAAVAAAAVTAVALTTGGSEKPSSSNTSPAGTGPGAHLVGILRLDTNGSVAERIELPLVPSPVPYAKSIAIGEKLIWVMDGGRPELFKVSPTTNTVIGTITSPRAPGIAIAGGSVWVLPDPFFNYRRLLRLSTETNAVTNQITTPSGCCNSITSAEGSVWLLSTSAVIRVDPKTSRIVKTIRVGGLDMAVADGKVWVLDGLVGKLTPIDVRTNRPGQSVALEGDPALISAGAGAVWVAFKDGTVQKITPGGGIDTVRLQAGPNDIVFDSSGVWVANPRQGTVTRLDPEAPSLDPKTIRVGGTPTQVAVGEGGVWIVQEPSAAIWTD